MLRQPTRLSHHHHSVAIGEVDLSALVASMPLECCGGDQHTSSQVFTRSCLAPGPRFGRNQALYPQKPNDGEDKDTPEHCLPTTYSCNARMGRINALPRLCPNIMIDAGALNAWRGTGIVVSAENGKGTH